MRDELDRTRALAAVFQAAALAKEVATTGTLNQRAYGASINSVFQLDPDSVTAIFGEDSKLVIGLTNLCDALKSTQPLEIAETVRYALGLIHIEGQLSKQSSLLEILRIRIEKSVEQSKHFDSVLNDTVIGQLADTYVETIGTLRFRISVKGDAALLQQTRYSNQVRAIFLAGVRAAMLWRQLGGRRWHLMFRRKHELAKAEHLLQQVSA